MSVEVFRQPMIILSSPETVTDLFEKRSALYSGRMHQVMMVDLYVLLAWIISVWGAHAAVILGRMGMGWQITQLQYGEAWRIRRKMFHQHFGPEAMKVYQTSQVSEAHKLLKNLIRHSAPLDLLADLRL